MKKLNTFAVLGAGLIVMLSSCSTSYNAMKGETDDLYFMASDANLATEFAVNNNNPQNFQSLKNVNSAEFEKENFSARNVNPEYIAKYQAEQNAGSENETVYFDEADAQANQGNINVYNNYSSNAGNFNSGFGNPWMMNSMFMGGFSPFGMGMGMGMMSPFGMGFYDPFWGPSMGMGMMSPFGFRPGFNLSIGMGFGFGNPWMRRGFGMGFYDPFFGGFGHGMAFGGMYPGYGFGGFGRPIFVLPGSEFNNRQIVRGARPTRGAGLATTTSRANAAAVPSTSRAAARRDATSSRSLTSTPNARQSSRDFGNSQNDYYGNSRSRVAGTTSAAPSTRNVGSAAMSRTGSRVGTTNTAPNTRNMAPNTRNTRSTYGTTPSRGSSPSYNRNASPSYNRSTSPTNRTVAPSRSGNSTPTRNSSPSYSAPSRSTGGSVGGGSVGGGRSSSGGGGASSGGSRGGRGN
ncbi:MULTISPECIES: hypothetical protein [Rhodonellum]|nr:MULTISPECIES: hypothetical protein [Rhodonellum]SDZ42525.1 hypothetical protein SAMN05444412_11420 [Rhodonellum ikkaensis]